jgi:uncharacterized protein
MMFWGSHAGTLELRANGGSVSLRGSFPYNKTAVLSDGGRNGGRPQKEIIASRAFAFRVNDPAADIHLLAGHSYDRPLASKGAGTLSLQDGDDELRFEAEIVSDIAATTYAADLLKQIRANLVRGLSPGFRLPPPRAVKNAETIVDEGFDVARGMHNAVIRTVNEALLYELSVVTSAAYPEAQIALRNWSPPEEKPFRPFGAPAFIYRRWRR